MDPQQAAFTYVRSVAMQLFGENKVYDGFLPPEDTPYPFIYIGEAMQSDRVLKGAVIGTVSITAHVWSNNPRARGQVSEMMRQVKSKLYENTEDYENTCFVSASSRVLADNSTANPLLHGVLELQFYFS